MSGGFELVYRSHLWRMAVSEYQGKPRLTIWAHYRDNETGEWKPCGSKGGLTPGCIVPADLADDFAASALALAQQLRSAVALD